MDILLQVGGSGDLWRHPVFIKVVIGVLGFSVFYVILKTISRKAFFIVLFIAMLGALVFYQDAMLRTFNKLFDATEIRDRFDTFN